MTTHKEVEAWKAVATDPGTAGKHPRTIQGQHPLKRDVVIRLGISREPADELFRTGLFAGLDVLITSATCWNSRTESQIELDEKLYTAHLRQLLGEVHEFAAFAHDMGNTSAFYRVILVDKDQKPRIPTEMQMKHLWGTPKAHSPGSRISSTPE